MAEPKEICLIIDKHGVASVAPPVTESLERWAVLVLDAWALATDSGGRCPEQWACMPWDNSGPQKWKCCLSGGGGRIFCGETADAARISAARALVAEDPTLPKEPGT